MARIGILTDTTHCLPPEFIRRYGIKVIPMGLVLNNKPYLDQTQITPAEFWNQFKTLKSLPTTFAPNPKDFGAQLLVVDRYVIGGGSTARPHLEGIHLLRNGLLGFRRDPQPARTLPPG